MFLWQGPGLSDFSTAKLTCIFKIIYPKHEYCTKYENIAYCFIDVCLKYKQGIFSIKVYSNNNNNNNDNNSNKTLI